MERKTMLYLEREVKFKSPFNKEKKRTGTQAKV